MGRLASGEGGFGGVALLLGALVISPIGSPPRVSAQEPPPIARPSSGEASLLSARTLGTGEVMVAGAVGWPWVWAQFELAPSSGFNLGLRASLLYGSPLMGLPPDAVGPGGEVSVPMRFHLHADGNVDIGLLVTPAFTLGESGLLGEGNFGYGGELGWSSRLEAGGSLAVRVQERLTVFFGVGGHVGLVHTPAVGEVEAVGGVFGSAGVEGLLSRDTMLFGEVQGGVGIAPSRGGLPLFGATVPPLLRVSVGVAYLF